MIDINPNGAEETLLNMELKVIRCSSCKWWHEGICFADGFCDKHRIDMGGNDFCSKGERTDGH